MCKILFFKRVSFIVGSQSIRKGLYFLRWGLILTSFTQEGAVVFVLICCTTYLFLKFCIFSGFSVDVLVVYDLFLTEGGWSFDY